MIKLTASAFYNEGLTKKDLSRFIAHSGQFSFGSQCETFEKKFAVWQGRNDCVLVTSGSMANLALLQSLKNLGRLKVGDSIGFSAVTWSTNVMPIIQLGFIPVPIDVEISSLNIDSGCLQKVLRNNKLDALFATNVLGLCADLERVAGICRENNILLIEDSCESLGSEYKGKKLGNFGLASTFSFYVGHQLSTIEGGAVVTDDPDLAEMLRMVRAHGWDRNLSMSGKKNIRRKNGISSEFYSRYSFYDLGYNMRPTEITGFLGLNQLEYIDRIIAAREHNFRYVSDRLVKVGNNLRTPRFDHMDRFSSFACPVLCGGGIQRDEIVKRCKNRIELRPILGGDITRQPFYRKHLKLPQPACPNAGYISSHGFYVGNNPDMTTKDLDEILEILTV
jgi:CDP-4-dehydro-6-deoxyglucose reductase, E1